jgi:hypothetical protein
MSKLNPIQCRDKIERLENVLLDLIDKPEGEIICVGDLKQALKKNKVID